jgi:hypothetical protein
MLYINICNACTVVLHWLFAYIETNVLNKCASSDWINHIYIYIYIYIYYIFYSHQANVKQRYMHYIYLYITSNASLSSVYLCPISLYVDCVDGLVDHHHLTCLYISHFKTININTCSSILQLLINYYIIVLKTDIGHKYVLSHEGGKNKVMMTTSRTYPWSFMTQILRCS